MHWNHFIWRRNEFRFFFIISEFLRNSCDYILISVILSQLILINSHVSNFVSIPRYIEEHHPNPVFTETILEFLSMTVTHSYTRIHYCGEAKNTRSGTLYLMDAPLLKTMCTASEEGSGTLCEYPPPKNSPSSIKWPES